MNRVGTLKRRLVVQFLIVLLPGLALNAWQAAVDGAGARAIERAFTLRSSATKAKEAYGTFVNAATDAVDAGHVSQRGVAALGTAIEATQALQKADAERPLGQAIDDMNAMLAALRADAGLKSLMPFRQTVPGVERTLAAALKDYEARNNEAVTAATAAAHRQQWLVPTVMLLALVIAGYCMWRVVRDVTNPLERAIDAAERVAQGDIEAVTQIDLQRDLGGLLATMRTMAQRLNAFVAAQEAMARAHADGIVSKRIDAAGFPGVYGRIARQVNEIVELHHGVTSRVVAVVRRYANGDFASDLELLPGELAEITAAMHGVKASLASVTSEVERLVVAARRGELDVRADESRFENDFRRLVAALNGLFEDVAGSVNQVVLVMDALASGDLTRRMSGTYQGIFERLSADTNATCEKLERMVAGIRHAADAISTASDEIARGNGDLSTRTEAQAATLEEAANSIQTFAQTIKRNAEAGGQANGLASHAERIARQGGDTVGRVVATMTDIAASSRRIQEIIAVIDGIAFQTNILALNAAVEAARAGEQGRGFAVVAAEVRTLAQRSGSAAKEIRELIVSSGGSVEAGATLVGDAGEQMRDIVEAAKRVSDIIGEITNASAEQARDIDRVSGAVDHMEETTQKNAALVEEAAAASASLRDQAAQLVHAVSLFKLREDGLLGASTPKRRPGGMAA